MLIKLSAVILVFVILCGGIIRAQNSDDISFFPSNIIFKPLLADHKEAALGILYYTATTNLKVDVGYAADVLMLPIASDNIKLAVGIEFLAYALSTSYAGRRLQIDAVDGLFGGYISAVKSFSENKVLVRIKIMHNSAHLVDGHYDNINKKWLNDFEPIPFTKDYGELTAAHELVNNPMKFRYYCGLSYSTLVRPADLKRVNYHAGVELSSQNILGKIFGQDESVYLAHHFYFSGTNNYSGNNHTVAGIKMGDWYRKGISFYLSYFKGFDIFNSYYTFKREKFGVGFKLDF